MAVGGSCRALRHLAWTWGGKDVFGYLLVPLTNSDSSFLGQSAGAATIFGWVFGVSLLVWMALQQTMGIRVSKEEEYEGLDIGECGMEAYPEFTSST